MIRTAALMLVWLLALIFAGPTATCPSGEYAMGVRPDGMTWCVRPPPRGCGDAAGSEERPCPADDRAPWPIAVHCTGGSIPIVVGCCAIGCEARH